jgi:GntR family transcriptional regulator, transcriptional repressor for pyruvate dehydrogenase complex
MSTHMTSISTARARQSDTGSRDSLKSDRVVAELERQILDGTLSPGDRLPTESELCDILSVSRSVVRDAIRTLVARGLVTVRQGHGTTVSLPDDSNLAQALLLIVARSDLTIGQLLDARKALDIALLPLLVENGRTGDWDDLDAILDRFAEAVAAGEWDQAREMHLAFHVRLLQTLHQPALELFLKPMQEIIVASATAPRLTQAEDWEVSCHKPIIDALRGGDVAAAEAAVRHHYDIARSPRYGDFRERSVRDVLQSHPWSRR